MCSVCDMGGGGIEQKDSMAKRMPMGVSYRGDDDDNETLERTDGNSVLVQHQKFSVHGQLVNIRKETFFFGLCQNFIVMYVARCARLCTRIG